MRQCRAADRAKFERRITGQKGDAIRISDQHALGTVLPSLLQRVEFDAHQRDAEQRPIVDCFGDVVANTLAHGVHAQIGAAAGLERLEKIRSILQVASNNHLVRIGASRREYDTVPAYYIERARIGLGNDALKLVIDLLELRLVLRIGERAPYVGIKR